jgi:uncharacterized protein (DUF305 family)
MNKHLVISVVGIAAVIGIVYYLSTEDERSRVGETMTYEETSPESTSMGDGDQVKEVVNDGTTERAFLENMIPHHQEAVDAAKTVLSSGQANTEVNALARAIISAQEKEIADMKSWYKAWYGVEYADKDTYSPMMRDLTELSGVELDRAFLEDMIAHHTEALQRAQAVAPAATHQETITLAQTIAVTQSDEIITMRMIIKQMSKVAE